MHNTGFPNVPIERNGLNVPFVWSPLGARSFETLAAELRERKTSGTRIISTNGCFDLLHTGHIRFLAEIRALGDVLVVGLNSDASVARLKGAGRPILGVDERAAMLAALRAVDYVVVFDDLLPTSFLDLLQPSIHCKAGDYSAEGLPEAAVVERHGGKVQIMPLSGEYSTSRLIERIYAATQASATNTDAENSATLGNQNIVLGRLLDGANVLRQTGYRLSAQIALAAERITSALADGHKLLVCGNGGSAADAQHFVAEFVGRFKRERRPLAAIALTTDTSIITSIGNDFGFEQVFSRQVQALADAGDILIAISTSGNSRNVLEAARMAVSKNVYVIALTGEQESDLKPFANLCFQVPTEDTALVQQSHIAILHILCELVEQELAPK